MSLKRLSVLVLGVLLISSGIVCAAHDGPHRVGAPAGSGYDVVGGDGGNGGAGIAGTWDYDPDQKEGERLFDVIKEAAPALDNPELFDVIKEAAPALDNPEELLDVIGEAAPALDNPEELLDVIGEAAPALRLTEGLERIVDDRVVWYT